MKKKSGFWKSIMPPPHYCLIFILPLIVALLVTFYDDSLYGWTVGGVYVWIVSSLIVCALLRRIIARRRTLLERDRKRWLKLFFNDEVSLRELSDRLKSVQNKKGRHLLFDDKGNFSILVAIDFFGVDLGFELLSTLVAKASLCCTYFTIHEKGEGSFHEEDFLSSLATQMIEYFGGCEEALQGVKSNVKMSNRNAREALANAIEYRLKQERDDKNAAKVERQKNANNRSRCDCLLRGYLAMGAYPPDWPK